MDTNGAGDTFATAYMLALARHARSPGADANWVASRAVMRDQVGLKQDGTLESAHLRVVSPCQRSAIACSTCFGRPLVGQDPCTSRCQA